MPPRVARPRKCVFVSHYGSAYKSGLFSFCTSSQLRAAIPPESPRFIEIPRPVQPNAKHRPLMKGTLPVPRRIFTSRPRDQAKATTNYLASATPEPIKGKSENGIGHTKGFISWKERQAEQRRQNLREGLIELHHRDARTRQRMADYSSRTQAINLALRDAPDRDDERLTRPSTLNADLLAKHRSLPGSGREIRLMHKTENVARTFTMQKEKRREKLHTLYVNAGNFITTEEQLEQVINSVFDDEKQFETDKQHGLSVWNYGVPENIQDLLGHRSSSIGRAIDSKDENAVLVKERMDKIAEELTGGKAEEAP